MSDGPKSNPFSQADIGKRVKLTKAPPWIEHEMGDYRVNVHAGMLGIITGWQGGDLVLVCVQQQVTLVLSQEYFEFVDEPAAEVSNPAANRPGECAAEIERLRRLIDIYDAWLAGSGDIDRFRAHLKALNA
jgi:hypothetical protein